MLHSKYNSHVIILLPAFDDRAGRAIDAGLFQHLLDMELPPHILEAAKSVGQDDSSQDELEKKLTLAAFARHFILLAAGLAISLVTFLVEEYQLFSRMSPF